MIYPKLALSILVLLTAACVSKAQVTTSLRSENRIVYRDLSHSVLPPAVVATELPAPDSLPNETIPALTPAVMKPPIDVSLTETTSSTAWSYPESGFIKIPTEEVKGVLSKAETDAYIKEPYTVFDGQNLSQIATRFTRLGGSIGQRMSAIYKRNPQAFTNGDPENLEAWSKLTIPTSEEISRTISIFSHHETKSSN